ncbi:MAG: HIT domain-containing protein [archaeon]
MTECLFCRIYKEKKEVIYENDFFFARFDKFPVSPGHAELIPIRHVDSLFDLTEKEWQNLKPALSGTKQMLDKLNHRELYEKLLENPPNEISVQFFRRMLEHIGLNKKPDAYNIGVNEGAAAGRTIEHLHIHLIPRYFGDVEDYVGGIRHIIPGMGNYRK